MIELCAEHMWYEKDKLPEEEGSYLIYHITEDRPVYAGHTINLRKRFKNHRIGSTNSALIKNIQRKGRTIPSKVQIDQFLTECCFKYILTNNPQVKKDMIKKYQPLFNLRGK